MLAVITVAGSDSGGGAGIQADLRTFAALGVYGTSVVTAITAQNTLGVIDTLCLPSKVIIAQMNAVLSDIDIQCAKTGMVATVETAEAAVDVLSGRDVPIVVDPVMEAEAGGSLMIGEPNDILARLLPNATVVTPNIREAEMISGLTIRSLKDMKRAAREISALGPKSVVITGGHLSGTDVFYDGNFKLLFGKLIKTGTHGAGCTFSAAMAAFIARGYSASESALMGKAFVTDAIRNSTKIGSGPGVVNQFAATLHNAERYLTLLDINVGLRAIKPINSVLIPQRGSNLAMAVSHATRVGDVAAVKGRIMNIKGLIAPVGCVEFGASRKLAHVVLNALLYDAKMKSAMNVRRSDALVEACLKLNLVMEGFDSANKPTGIIEGTGPVSAIESSVKRRAGVPDVLIDFNNQAADPIAYILGHSARHVATVVAKISSTIR